MGRGKGKQMLLIIRRAENLGYDGSRKLKLRHGACLCGISGDEAETRTRGGSGRPCASPPCAWVRPSLSEPIGTCTPILTLLRMGGKRTSWSEST